MKLILFFELIFGIERLKERCRMLDVSSAQYHNRLRSYENQAPFFYPPRSVGAIPAQDDIAHFY
ncbi:hypothetical protein FY557_09970 [Chryseobacterium sp. SN22]|nr:hypothetical protein FY557_09970 [Chryseobacterium sp. SN22]